MKFWRFGWYPRGLSSQTITGRLEDLSANNKPALSVRPTVETRFQPTCTSHIEPATCPSAAGAEGRGARVSDVCAREMPRRVVVHPSSACDVSGREAVHIGRAGGAA
jgi:hypothetical protein